MDPCREMWSKLSSTGINRKFRSNIPEPLQKQLANCRITDIMIRHRIAMNQIRTRIGGFTTAILVNTAAVMNARVTMGTSRYHASNGSLAAPSILSVLYVQFLQRSARGGEHWQFISHVGLSRTGNFNCDYLPENALTDGNLGRGEETWEGHKRQKGILLHLKFIF